MSRLWRSVIMVIFVVASLLSNVDVAFGRCVKFPHDATDPSVEVCEHLDSYSFRIGDSTRAFMKEEFVRRLASAAESWLSTHDHKAQMMKHSEIQIWMTVPLANPLAAQPRAIVETSHGRIAFWFDLNSAEWRFEDDETAILGRDSYPTSFGHRPASIIVEAHETIHPDVVRETLTQQGATSVTDRGNGLFSATCQIFDETKLASKFRRMTSVVKYAQVNSVMEWIADRQMVFTFKPKNT